MLLSQLIVGVHRRGFVDGNTTIGAGRVVVEASRCAVRVHEVLR